MNKKLFFTLLFFAFFTEFSNANCQFRLYDDIPIQRVRIDFTAPTGYIRHLLLAFTPHNEATDGVDYGYDSLNMDSLPYDLNWLIDDGRYVIQGVGVYREDMVYPLGLFMNESGEFGISLAGLENFEAPIPVYLFDSLTKEFTLLNGGDYVNTTEKGDYLERYFIAFSNTTNTLSMPQSSLRNNPKIYLSPNSRDLVIDFDESIKDINIRIHNIEGKRLFESVYTDISKVNIPTSTLTSRLVLVQITNRMYSLTRTIVVP